MQNLRNFLKGLDKQHILPEGGGGDSQIKGGGVRRIF